MKIFIFLIEFTKYFKRLLTKMSYFEKNISQILKSLRKFSDNL